MSSRSTFPASGCSEMPRGEITIANYARIVEALCQHAAAPRCGVRVLVGNSMGGFVSNEVAIRYPGGVERLMLVASAGSADGPVPRAALLAVT